MSAVGRFCCKSLLSISAGNIDSISSVIRNNDSKEPARRFYCFKFLFHRARPENFATKSALLRHHQSTCRGLLSEQDRTTFSHTEFFAFLTQLRHALLWISAMHIGHRGP